MFKQARRSVTTNLFPVSGRVSEVSQQTNMDMIRLSKLKYKDTGMRPEVSEFFQNTYIKQEIEDSEKRSKELSSLEQFD